jgi:hypothetical protein
MLLPGAVSGLNDPQQEVVGYEQRIENFDRVCF